MAVVTTHRLQCMLLVALLLSSQAVLAHRFSQGTCCARGDDFLFSLEAGTCTLLVNEQTASLTGKWSPWSHRPRCNTPMDENSPQYCLFTHDTFRGGHGVSILTTAEVAADVATVLDDANVPPSARDFNQLDDTKKPPYKIVDVPGRGKATIATRKIRALETIILSYPAILTINDIEGANFEEIMGLLEKAVDQLPPEERDNVYSLARGNSEELPIRDIIWTNSFGIDLGGVQHMGVFPRSSRMNHDCRPNTFYRLLPQTLAQKVIAVRDIEPGEEITHSYTGHGMPYAERRIYLDGWNFNCTCSLCTAPEEERSLSDRRRYRLRDILMSLTSHSVGARELGKVLHETIDMIEKEELWVLLGHYYAGFAQAYLAAVDFESARKYGFLAEEMAERYGQEDDIAHAMGNFWQALKDRMVDHGLK